MYGEDGWCRGCGTPTNEQSGALVIQGSGFPKADVWMPNWRYDVVCVSARLATEITERFNVNLGEVHTPRNGPTGAKQILPARMVEAWHHPEALARAARARLSKYEGERTGSTCGECNRWKWLPVRADEAPIITSAVTSTFDAIASPEAFGDGLSSFRHLLFRRPLGEALVAATPRNWDLVEVEMN